MRIMFFKYFFQKIFFYSSINRLFNMISCYADTKSFLIGERYGYAVDKDFGYSYPTGGSG